MATVGDSGYRKKKSRTVLRVRGITVTLRCVLDGLLLPAELCGEPSALIVYDGVEAFEMEAVEALYYEVVEARPDELLILQGPRFRLLRRAEDFELLEC
jgi:hypothetical protein